jgi:RHS repeat-associated protein
VNGTLSASSFSCCPDRQERRPGLSACHRPGRIRGAFRKTCFSQKRAHLSGNRPLRAKSRTTTLGPFGEVIRATGPMAKANPFRFSTKYQDDESDLLYYGYRYYKASTGTWLSRDPLNAAMDTEGRYELLEQYGFDEDFSRSVAAIPADLNDYIFAHNRSVMDYDLLGLCDPLPDSGPGDFHSNLWGHNLFHGPASSLTFKVCCPAAEQYLASYGISALTSPPPTTGHGHNFPGDFTTVTPPSGSGPCYTIVINVTSTASLGYWNNPGVNFVNEIRVTGKCCACSSGATTRSDPPTLPPSPPPPRHGSGL